MPAGNYFTPAQVASLQQAIDHANKVSGLIFTLYVGVAQEPSREHARRLHAAMEFPQRSVLVLCDPEAHVLEIVTGGEARRYIDDTECGLASATMQTSFTVGDLPGGLIAGIQQLGEAGRAPETLHRH